MLKDRLGDTPAYQRYLKEGELKALHQAVLGVVQARFPELVPLAKKQTDVITDPAILLDLTIKMSAAQTLQEAGQTLLALDGEQKKS